MMNGKVRKIIEDLIGRWVDIDKRAQGCVDTTSSHRRVEVDITKPLHKRVLLHTDPRKLA